MSIILKQPVTGPAAWTGKAIQNDTTWIEHLQAADIQAMDQALAALKAKGLAFPNFRQEDFPIGPALVTRLAALSEELENGRGFSLWRGLPVHRYSEEELKAVYYGIGLHLGMPVCQNPRGDPSDVVGLLCVRKAKQGGVSSLVSVARIYNEILEKHPEYLGLFYRMFYFEHLCEPEPSLSPIFSYHKGKLSCRYLRQYLELGCDIKGVPLSKVEMEALDCFDRIMHSPEIRVDMLMEPGDLQFEDHDDVAARRRMLRLWLKMPNARELAPEFPGRNGFPPPNTI